MDSQYPKWIYGPNGDKALVQNVEQHRTFVGWAETPAAFYDVPAGAAPAAAPAIVPVSATARAVTGAAEAALKRFHTLPAKAIADQVAELATIEEVREVLDMEELRPGGARKGVLQAVSARMEQLAPPSGSTATM